MLSVKLTTTAKNGLEDLYFRQTPGRKGIWEDCTFIQSEPNKRYDWWIICHATAITQVETAICDADHIVYISMEPNEAGIPEKFLNQFSKLIICDRQIHHPFIQYNNGLTWWVGMQVKHENGHQFSADFSLDYDKLKEMAIPQKQDRISVVCSRNQSLPGHFKRLEFLDKLMAHPIGKYVDLYGGGHRTIPDKWDAIAPYKYHLILENSVVPDYWSEKLGDAYLGFAFPIYYGCPNIHHYFSEDSLALVDIDNFEQTVAALETLITEDTYQKCQPTISAARTKVLNEYNIFQMMAETCTKPGNSFKNCKLKPVSYFQRSAPRRMARKIIYKIRGIQ